MSAGLVDACDTGNPVSPTTNAYARVLPLEHRSYPRIATTKPTAGTGGDWVATEKIHGASFVIGTDGSEVRFGKRKAWLSGEEPFFGWQVLRGSLRDATQHLYAALGKPRAVRTYGELFGGAYPHPDVPSVPGMAPVQTGVWYTPSLAFVVFDVLVEGDGDHFLGFDEMVALAGEVGLSSPPLVARGGAAQMLALDVRRATAVPNRFGLPAIANNVAEGLVLKPTRAMAPDDRPVLKRKIAEFQEARFDRAVAFDPAAYLSLPELLRLCASCVNEARIMSARSKIGTDLAAILDEVVLDVMVDLESVLPRRFAALSPTESAALHRHIRELATLSTGQSPVKG